MVILDLEDSVTPDLKEAARTSAVSALADGGWRCGVRAIRINALDTVWAEADLAALSGCAEALDEVVVPKVHSLRDLDAVDRMLTDLEHAAALEIGAIGVQVQIEDAPGLLSVDELATHSRVTTLAFGPVDLTASLGLRDDVAGADTSAVLAEMFTFALMRIAVAARANGKTALDGPHTAIRDLDGLRRSAATSAALGFDGKWVLHPDQVEVVNRAFTPSDHEIARAEAILASASAPRGAILLEGEMVDEATRKQALVVMARAQADRP